MYRNLNDTGPPGRSAEVANRASIRRTNLGLILRTLRDHGPRSRTELSEDLRLPKATISALIAELVDRRLVREGEVARTGGIGRPQRIVELDGKHLCGLGVEISVDYARAIALGFSGSTLLDQRITLAGGQDVPVLLDAVAALIGDALRKLRKSGHDVVRITIASPGDIDTDAGVVLFAANMRWSGLPVVAEIATRLGPRTPPIDLDNDARLGAVAEYAVADGVDDLVYITGEVGVGGGIVMGGRLLLGASGFAGEIGHMPMGSDSHPCPCGQRGCWETLVGLEALMRVAADPEDPVRDPARDLEDRLAEIRARARTGDPRTLAAVDQVARDLGRGIALLITVLNPAVVVLGGYFAFLGDLMLGTVQHVVDRTVVAQRSAKCELRLSTLGFTGASRGAAQASLEGIFRNPACVPGSGQSLPA